MAIMSASTAILGRVFLTPDTARDGRLSSSKAAYATRARGPSLTRSSPLSQSKRQPGLFASCTCSSFHKIQDMTKIWGMARLPTKQTCHKN